MARAAALLIRGQRGSPSALWQERLNTGHPCRLSTGFDGTRTAPAAHANAGGIRAKHRTVRLVLWTFTEAR
jgi:hypothetical protein